MTESKVERPGQLRPEPQGASRDRAESDGSAVLVDSPEVTPARPSAYERYAANPRVDDGEFIDDVDGASRVLYAVIWGVSAALVSLAVVVALVLIGWGSGEASSESWAQAVGVGAAVWLVTLGAHLDVDNVVFAFTPLLATFATIAFTVRCARRGLPGTPEPVRPRDVVGFVAGFDVIVALAVGAAALGPAHPSMLSVPIAALVVPLAAIFWASWRDSEDPGAGLPLAASVRKAIAPALEGAVAMLVVGMAVVMVAVVTHWGQIGNVQAELGVSGVAAALLWVAQTAALPNFGLWAVSFMAGGGFQVVDGAETTLSSAESGLMPIVPVLAALPAPGPFPPIAWLLLLAPVAVGWWIGHRALVGLPRLARTGSKLSVAILGAVLAAVALGLLDGFAGGSWGAYRLGNVGAPALVMTPLLAAEFAAGAVACVMKDVWSLLRR